MRLSLLVGMLASVVALGSFAPAVRADDKDAKPPAAAPASVAAEVIVLLATNDGTGIDESLQRLNAVKNILAAVVNAVAGLIFAIVADVDWWVVLLIGVGSVIGGQIGATVGRRLPPTVLRVVIVCVGVVALIAFLLG